MSALKLQAPTHPAEQLEAHVREFYFLRGGENSRHNVHRTRSTCALSDECRSSSEMCFALMGVLSVQVLEEHTRPVLSLAVTSTHLFSGMRETLVARPAPI